MKGSVFCFVHGLRVKSGEFFIRKEWLRFLLWLFHWCELFSGGEWWGDERS